MEALHKEIKLNNELILKYEKEINDIIKRNEILENKIQEIYNIDILERTFIFYNMKKLPKLNDIFQEFKIKDMLILKYDIENETYDLLIEFYETPKDIKSDYKIANSNISCRDMGKKISIKRNEGLNKLKKNI